MYPPENIYSGTSGLVLPVKQSEYPPAYRGVSRLTYYASLFNSIEINSIFYKLPKPATVLNWVQSVPGHFRFTFKLSKSITHSKELEYDSSNIDLFMKAIAPAMDKMICILIQFPRGLKINNLKKVDNLLSAIKIASSAIHLAVEFRHPTWYNQDVYNVLDAHDAAMVIHDMQPAPPVAVPNSPMKYIRFHGPGGRYRGSYTNEFLCRYAQLIREWKAEGKTVCYYFNNTMGDAFNNLQALNEMQKSNGKT
ncbi:MAG TPA: DUF72 domain-containing protein, partial [Ferruginibacter sp.]|nr:DUF72 domain-containing protein [Ferruginibacter sp.]